MSVEVHLNEANKNKIDKYNGHYGNDRVIPLVCRYNGTVFDKFLKLLNQLLPEIPDAYVNKHCCLAVARANEDARLNYTSLYKTVLRRGQLE